jgi:hypothetical protein
LTIFLSVIVVRFVNDSFVLLSLFDPLPNFRFSFGLAQPLLLDVLFDSRPEDVELGNDASDKPLVTFPKPLVLVRRAWLNSCRAPETFLFVKITILLF